MVFSVRYVISGTTLNVSICAFRSIKDYLSVMRAGAVTAVIKSLFPSMTAPILLLPLIRLSCRLAPPPPTAHPRVAIAWFNCRSLAPKIDYLRTVAVSVTPSIIALCETWLDESVPDSALFIPNFHMIRHDRNRHSGGLLLYISDDIPSTCLRRHPSLELLVVELTFIQGPLTLALYYGPPPVPSILMT